MRQLQVPTGPSWDYWAFKRFGDGEDIIDQELERDRTQELELLIAGLCALQEALPELRAEIDDTSLSTVLPHHDMSRQNILVDNYGAPMALLGWDNIYLLPQYFLYQPGLLDSRDSLQDLELLPHVENHFRLMKEEITTMMKTLMSIDNHSCGSHNS